MSLNAKITSWQGKTVWVIGGSAGIGAAVVQQLVAAGARVAVSARSVEKLAAFVLQCNTTNIRPKHEATSVPFDFSDPVQTESAWQVVTAAMGLPDVVIVNAGTYVPMSVRKFDRAQVQHQFDVNVGGPLNVLTHWLPTALTAKRSHIVLVSSVAGYGGLPRSMAYGGSKAALSYIAECLYLELSRHNIGVSLVCPGFVATDLTAGNDFAMPALMQPADAAAALVKGLERGAFDIHFPKRFSGFLKALQFLPYSLYFKLVAKTL